jgi:steroid delta-isomerase-like uncharacterized protein
MPSQVGHEGRYAELAALLAKRFENAVAARDLDAISDVFTDDVSYEHPALRAPLQGRVALLTYWRDLFAALPDLEFRQPIVFRSLADPRAVGTFYVFAGTFEGGILPGGFAPTGRQIRVHGMTLMELRDDRVARLRVFTDMTHFERELEAAGSQ